MTDALTDEQLLPFGYARGNYWNRCIRCDAQSRDVAKRCRVCRDCAVAAYRAAQDAPVAPRVVDALTDDDIAQIRARAASRSWSSPCNDDRAALLAEVDRLRAELDATNAAPVNAASADAWNVFLSEHRDYPELVAVKIAEAIEALERKVYVPGVWRCARCNFRLVQSNLNARDGTITARDETGDKCPNCDGPLWRVAAMDERNEAYRTANETFDRLEEMKRRAEKAEADRDAAVARAEKLEKALRAHLYSNRACSHPVGGEGSTARRAWEDQCAADQMAREALGQETLP